MRKLGIGSWAVLSFVLAWIFKDYIPAKLFDWVFGSLASVIATRVGMTQDQIMAVIQTALIPTGVAALVVWSTFKIALYLHRRQTVPVATPSVVGEPLPDMSIHDLFFHIRADVLENAQEKRWEIVARDIMDRFSTGQLSAWGREIDKRSRRGGALTLIPRDYWRNRTFVYTFFGDDKGIGVLDGREIAHTYSYQNSDDLQYADIRVNRAQAFSIWPQRFKEVVINIRAAEPRRGQ